MEKRNYCDENGRCTVNKPDDKMCLYFSPCDSEWCTCNGTLCTHNAGSVTRMCTNPAAIQAAKEVNNG
jgi:hypothetical protein